MLLRNAADALEAFQIQVAEIREVKDGYYEAMANWRVRAEKAEAEIRDFEASLQGIAEAARVAALEEAAKVVDDMLLADLGEEIAAAIRALKAQDVVSSAPQPTTEAKNSMPDIADFADELETLVREMLDAGVDREQVKQTLAAAQQVLEDEKGDEEEPPEDETA
jgi:ABC-type transporter Mla subunit MlaD